MISKIIGAISWQQVVSFVFGTLAVALINKAVPAGSLHDALLQIDAAVLSFLLVILRKPSTDGGSAISK